jgi:hypothetical protein
MKPIKLRAPESYWEASEEVRALVVNGCGPSGWKEKIVPDTIYGLNVKDACEIHDWEYEAGETLRDKILADINLLVNLIIIIINHTKKKWLIALRCLRAMKYFIAVLIFGRSAFWAGKRKNGNG